MAEARKPMPGNMMPIEDQEPNEDQKRRMREQLEGFRREKRIKEVGIPESTRGTMGRSYKKGGYVKAADGCAKRGKTKAKMV